MFEDNIFYYHKVLGHKLRKSLIQRGKLDDQNMSKFMAINYIYDRQLENVDTYARDVGKQFGLNKSSTSEMIKNLQEEKMLMMVVDKNDARRKKLILTDKAIQLVEDERKDFHQFYLSLVDGLSEEEIESYINTSKKIINNLKEVENND